jgi:hypothetical protein
MGKLQVNKAFENLKRELVEFRLALNQERGKAILANDAPLEDRVCSLDSRILEISRSLQEMHESLSDFPHWSEMTALDMESSHAPQAQKVGHDVSWVSFRADTDATLQHLIRSGAVVAPMEIYKRYKGHDVRATIERDGTITCFGKTFTSLSYAAIEVVLKLNPTRVSPQENGWRFWQYLDPQSGEYRQMDTLRH